MISSPDDFPFSCILYGDRHDLEGRHPSVSRVFPRTTFSDHARSPGVEDDFPCFFYLVDGEGRPASWIRAYPDILSIDGKQHRWAWLYDLFTVPEHRGKGLSTRLCRNMTHTLHQRGIGFAGVFSTEVTLHVFAKLGHVLPGHVPRYLMLKSVRPLVEAHFDNRVLRGAAYVLAQPLVSTTNLAFRSIARMRGIRAGFVEVPSCDQGDIPDVLEQLNRTSPVHFHKDADWLQWKIDTWTRIGGNQSALYVLRALPDGEPLGYAVVGRTRPAKPLAGRYKDFELMTLLDFAVTRPERPVCAALLRELVKRFFACDAEVLEVYSNVPPLNAVMGTSGMLRVGKGMSFSFSVPEDWNLDPAMNELTRWPLTHFSGDGFCF
jgi:GNAT superfamily N-acetyltransferase